MSAARARLRTVSEGLFLSGGVGALALGLAAAVESEAARALLVSLTAFVTAAHLGVSLLRARQVRMLRVTALALVLAALLSGAVVLGGYASFDVLFTIVAVVLPAHAALQAFRVGVVLALRHGGAVHRRWSTAAVVVGAGAGAVAAFSGPRELLIWRGPLSTAAGTALWIAACLCALACAIIAARLTNARVRVVLALVLPAVFAGAPLLFAAAAPPDWALAGPPAVAHALQLIALALVLEPRVARLQGRSFDPFAYLGFALALGCLLTIDVPLVAARVFSLDPVTVLLAVAASATLVQALLDVPLWSLHDPNLLRAAGDGVPPAAHGRHQVSNARAIAVAVPISVVLGLALFEPIQTVLLLPADETTAAERLALARELLPEDQRIVVADARAALHDGDVERARQELSRAAHALAPDAVRLGVVACVEGSDALALSCFEDLPAVFDGDLEIGALRLDVLDAHARFADAVLVARALARAHPREPHALALLGSALARAGDQDARPTLEAALDSGKPGADTDLDPVLARAAAWRGRIARIDGRRDEATLWLERAQRSAVSEDLPDLAVLAFAERARLLDESGDARASLDAWKVALGAAEDAARPLDEADAFLGFEALLERSAGSPIARYTCVVAAERVLAELAEVDASAAMRARVLAARRAVIPFVADEERRRVDADLDAAIGHVVALEYEASSRESGPSAPGLADEQPTDQNAPE